MNHNIFKDTEPVDPELLKNAEIAVRRGLVQSFRLHEELGEEGTRAKQQNEFGEMAMQMDVYSEKVMLESLEQLPYKLLVRTEEHGEVEINSHLDTPRLLAVMDGLDGSSVYEKHRGEAEYGPMFVVFSNDNPTYDDYLVSGLMLLSSGEMLIAKKGEGLVGENVKTGETYQPRANQMAELDEDAIVFADASNVSPDHSLYGFFTLNGAIANKLSQTLGVKPFRTGSTAANLAAVAKGEATLDIGATRKGNLEFASGYAIVTAAGGMMQTEEGGDLGQERFLEFGQTEHIMVIAAANSLVADEVHYTLAV